MKGGGSDEGQNNGSAATIAMAGGSTLENRGNGKNETIFNLNSMTATTREEQKGSQGGTLGPSQVCQPRGL